MSSARTEIALFVKSHLMAPQIGKKVEGLKLMKAFFRLALIGPVSICTIATKPD
jgi:hypothetical protein